MGHGPWVMGQGRGPEAEGRGLRAEYDDVTCGHFFMQSKKIFVLCRRQISPAAYGSFNKRCCEMLDI